MTQNTQIALFVAFVIAITLACVDLALSERPFFGAGALLLSMFYTYTSGTLVTPMPASQRRRVVVVAVVFVALLLAGALSGTTQSLNAWAAGSPLRIYAAPFVWLVVMARGWFVFQVRLRAQGAKAETSQREPA